MRLVANLTFGAAILLLVFASLVMYRCNEPHIEYQTDTDTVIIRDTTFHTDTLQMPVPYEVKVPDSIPYYIPDTTCRRIWADYYSHKFYSDTLKNDTLALIVLSDTVYMNSLKGRKLLFQNRSPTQIITNTVTTTANNNFFRFNLGPVVTYRKDNGIGVGLSGLLQHKKRSYSYTYDITNKAHYLGFYFTLTTSKGH